MDFKIQRLVSDPNSPHNCGSKDKGISSRDHLSSPINDPNRKDSTRELDDHPTSSIRIGFGNNQETELGTNWRINRDQNADQSLLLGMGMTKPMKPKSALHKSFATMGKLLPLPSPSLLVQKFQRLWKTQQQIPLRNATTSASSLSDSFCYHHGEFLKNQNQRKQPIQMDNVYSEYSEMDPIDQELAGPNHHEFVKGGPLDPENRTPPTRKFAIRDQKFATRARTIASSRTLGIRTRTIASSRTLGIRTRTIASPTFAIRAREHTSRTFATSSSASASNSIDPTPDVVTETLTFASRKLFAQNPKTRKLLPGQLEPAQKSKRLNHTI